MPHDVGNQSYEKHLLQLEANKFFLDFVTLIPSNLVHANTYLKKKANLIFWSHFLLTYWQALTELFISFQLLINVFKTSKNDREKSYWNLSQCYYMVESQDIPQQLCQDVNKYKVFSRYEPYQLTSHL